MNGDVVYDTQTVEDGETATKPETDPTKSGHTFVGWYTESGTKFDFNTPINEDITLTAKWSDVSAINAGITITKEEGWLESSYIEWSPATSDEIDGYNVYVREAGGEYVKLDDMLVRAYSNTAGGTTIDYYRADALGLKAGTYQMKVVGTASGIEAEKVYAESSAITVEAHDRSGFAFVNGTASGAYKEDGTLKDGAIILYVTNENWQTVSVTYSGTTVTGIDKILGEGYKSNKGATKPLCVRIIGSIGNGNKLGFKAGGDLEMKALTQDQGVTIEGVGNDATANGWGLHITTASNVEVRNLAFMEMQGTTKDGVSIESNCDHIWVHNCDFFYGHNWGGDQKKGDGSLDTKGSTNITHSYNHFWDSGKCNLQGMEKATDSGTYEITYHHNWYDHSDSRHPRIRRASVHIYNNYFDGNAKYGVGVTNGASAFVENNYFRSTTTMRPMLSSMQGTDAKGDGTFSSEDGGMIKAFGNKYDCNASNLKLITQKNTTDKTDIDCYEADSRNEQVPGEYKTKQGATTYNNFDTASGFYTYTPDTPEVAKANVEKYAGRMNGGDLHYTFNNAVEDSNYDIITELANKIKNYASKLVKAMGSSSAGGSDGDGDGPSSGGGDTGSSGNDSGAVSGNLSATFTATANISANDILLKVTDGGAEIASVKSLVAFSKKTTGAGGVQNSSPGAFEITLKAGYTYTISIKLGSSGSSTRTITINGEQKNTGTDAAFVVCTWTVPATNDLVLTSQENGNIRFDNFTITAVKS